MRRNLLASTVSVLIVALTSALGALLVVGPATAESGPNANANVPGAFGKLTSFAWRTADTVYFYFYLEDTAGDGDHAEARVQSADKNGQVTSFAWHSASGYGEHLKFLTHVTNTAGVAQIRIQVCRKGDDLPDICDWSGWLVNPNHQT